MPTITSTPTFGMPGAGRLAAFRRKILSLSPALYFLCEPSATDTAIADVSGRMTLGKQGSPTVGPPLAAGTRSSVRVTSSNAWGGLTTLDPGSTGATLGMICEYFGGTDEFFWGAWNGSGFGFGYAGGMSIYIGGTSTGSISPSGRHFWVATYDGANARMYKDGTLVVGPTARTWSMGTPTWGINWYSNATHVGDANVSDCFLLKRQMTDAEVATLSALVGLA